MSQHRKSPHGVADGSADIPTLTADDHSVFRETLRDLVAAAPGFVLVGEACSGEEAVSAVDRLSPRLVIMDVVMPGMDGIVAARVILSRHPELVVVLVSVREPDLYPGATALGSTVVLSRKQDLRPSSLGDFWESQHGADRDAMTSTP